MAATLALFAAFLFALAATLQQKGALNLPTISLADPMSLRSARGREDVADRHARAARRLPVPGRRARPRPPLDHPAAARHDRRVRAAARLLPDEAARRSSRGDRRGRDHRRARPVRLLRRPGRRERERVQRPVGDRDRPARRCSASCCWSSAERRALDEGGRLRHGRGHALRPLVRR